MTLAAGILAIALVLSGGEHRAHGERGVFLTNNFPRRFDSFSSVESLSATKYLPCPVLPRINDLGVISIAKYSIQRSYT